MSPHRIGIVGCGRRGRAFAAAIASLDATDLVVCLDDDPAAARACAGAYGGTVAQSWTEPLVRLLRVVMPRPLFAHISLAVDPGPPQAPQSVRQTVWATPHHALDLLVHLFDGPPAEVVADGGPLLTPRDQSATFSVPPRADALVADLYFDRERHAALSVGGGDADPELGPIVLDLTDGATRVRIWSNWTVAEILPLDGRSPDPPPLPGVRLDREGRALLARVEPDGLALRTLVQAFIASEPADDRLARAVDSAQAVALTRAVLAAVASGRTQTLSAA